MMKTHIDFAGDDTESVPSLFALLFPAFGCLVLPHTRGKILLTSVSMIQFTIIIVVFICVEVYFDRQAVYCVLLCVAVPPHPLTVLLRSVLLYYRGGDTYF